MGLGLFERTAKQLRAQKTPDSRSEWIHLLILKRHYLRSVKCVFRLVIFKFIWIA